MEKRKKIKMCDIVKIVIIIFTISVLTVNVQAAEYSFNRTWGSFGTGSGQFYTPYGVSVDSAGNVYVADTGNNRIQKFSSDGTYITQWGSYGTGNGQLYFPQGISVDSAGNVYVADTYNSRIQKFNSDGTYITQWGSNGSGDGQFYRPLGAAVDSAGNVYIVDNGNSRIQKFNSDGTYITQWGSNGSGDGQFYNTNGVSVDSEGNVYVADSWNNRIQKFNSDGAYLIQWGSPGNDSGQFRYPNDVSVDSAGDVYVTDYGQYNNRIQKFNSDGTYLTQWGSPGSGNGQFTNPRGISVDSEGNVYVADTGNNRIQKFSPTPTITVLSPNGGESWNRGNIYEITWNSTNNPGANVNITLLKNGVVDSTIVSSTANDGSYNWTIPSSQTLGADYKIKVTSTTNSTYTDTSDNDFTIGGINITSPNGGEVWARGTVNVITWDSAGTPGSDVTIQLLKNGVVDSTIVSSTANDGSYNWTIPPSQTLGADYKIRVTSTTNSAYTDDSDNTFNITKKSG